MKLATALIATATALALPTVAMANNTSENISTCQVEIRDQLAPQAQNVDIDFKTVKGTSRLQTLSFRLELNGERDNVKCKVRRDDTVEIDWGKDIKPAQPQLVEAPQTQDTVSGGE